MLTSPGGPVFVMQFASVTADETLGPWVKVFGRPNVTIYLSGVGTITSGVLTIEEAAPVTADVNAPVFGADTGKYGAITTQNADTVTGGSQLGIHLPSDRAYHSVRCRISTAIGGGGSITASVVAY